MAQETFNIIINRQLRRNHNDCNSNRTSSGVRSGGQRRPARYLPRALQPVQGRSQPPLATPLYRQTPFGRSAAVCAAVLTSCRARAANAAPRRSRPRRATSAAPCRPLQWCFPPLPCCCCGTVIAAEAQDPSEACLHSATPEPEPELEPEPEPESEPELEPELEPESEPELEPVSEPELEPESSRSRSLSWSRCRSRSWSRSRAGVGAGAGAGVGAGVEPESELEPEPAWSPARSPCPPVSELVP